MGKACDDLIGECIIVNELHKKILELLKEIDFICKKYDITYYAAGGTTIGAIRHRGFIPWDDDADIYMTRDNFYKFRRAFKIERPEGRVLDCLDDNPKYPGTIPRYIDDTTTIVAKFHCLNTCSAGVVIDIFVLDPVPSDPELQREHIGKLNIYADMVMPYYGYTNRADDKYLELYEKYQKRVETEGRENIIKELEQDLFSMQDDDCDYYILRWGTLSHVFEKSMFGSPVYFEYEDMQIPCPCRWYDYLVQLYGPKWMYIPPHIEDEAHDFIVDIEHRYTNYLIDADRFIPKDEAYRNYLTRKNLFVQREKLIRPLKNEILDADKKYVLISQEKYLQNNGINIDKLFENEKYSEIVKSYKTYLDMQFSVNFVGKMNHANTYRYNNKVFIALPDDQLYILLTSLFMTGMAKKCKDLILLRKSKGVLPDNIGAVECKVNNLYYLYKLFYSGNFEEATEFIGHFSSTERKKITDVLKIDIQLMIKNDVEYGTLRDLILKCIDDYKSDYEFLKIMGDLYYREGEYEKAKEYYKSAIPGLTNGIMMLDIKDKFDLTLNYDTPIDLSIPTVLQNKQLELLTEIDQICEANDIDYYLSGSTLLFGYYKNILGDEYKTNTIIMTPENALKFIKVCETQLPENRNIDYTLNNSLHNGHTIYYCDNRTLSLNWLKIQESYNIGIHITIYILKKKDKNAFRWCYTRCLDALQTVYNRVKDNKYKKKSRHIGWIVIFLVTIIGKNKLSRIVFNSYINGALKNPNEDYYLSKNNYKRSIGKYYKKEYFIGHDEVEIYGKTFHAPANVEEYIYDINGKYAKESIKIRDKNLPLFKVADCNLSFNDIEQLLKFDLFTNENWSMYKKGTALNPQIRRLNNIVKNYWNILLRGEDRFKLFIEYEPLKDKIMKWHENGDYNKLEDVLQDYDKCVRNNLRYNLGLMFDTDIFEIYCDLLIHNGEAKMVDKLRNSIPKEHTEQIIVQ